MTDEVEATDGEEARPEGEGWQMGTARTRRAGAVTR